ncbi:MAG: putative flap endonuclease-1-like 5' DNA nuclease [Saprospiraceae bacterium]|jgi:predicted flap endonuclease-1-like 5' DNA nuclease
MITLISICDLFWWLWLLPFLLGALITWLYWRHEYANMVADYDDKIKGLNGRISSLEGDLDECGSRRSELEGDLAITKGRMREIEAEMMATRESADSTKNEGNGNKGKGGNSNTSALTADSTKKFGTYIGSSSKNLGETSHGGKSRSLADDPDKNHKGSIADKSNSGNDPSNDKNSGSGKGSTNLRNVASSLAGAGAAGLTSSKVSGNDADDSTSTSSASGKKSIYRNLKSENLQIIEGIGPKMESVLKENGVSSHSDLAAQNPDSLLAILGKYGDKYKIIDPTTWAQQAGYAASGDYSGMIDLQKKLDTGKDNAAGLTASKLEKYLVKTGALKAFKQDDLKAIEGIGPATEKLLHENDIKTWRGLANSEASAVKAILSAAGSRFALGDPTNWPKQAELAADGKFDELREYQDFLDGGKG